MPLAKLLSTVDPGGGSAPTRIVLDDCEDDSQTSFWANIGVSQIIDNYCEEYLLTRTIDESGNVNCCLISYRI
jgi:hypothetical protein